MDTLTRWDNLAMPNGISNLRGTAPITGKPNNQQVFSVQSNPTIGATTFVYDNMGNLVSEMNPQTETMDQIYWTADGKLAVTMKQVDVVDSLIIIPPMISTVGTRPIIIIVFEIFSNVYPLFILPFVCFLT